MLLGGPRQHVAEIEQALARPEMIGSEDEFAADVVKVVERQAVRILARLEARDTSDECRWLWRGDCHDTTVDNGRERICAFPEPVSPQPRDPKKAHGRYRSQRDGAGEAVSVRAGGIDRLARI